MALLRVFLIGVFTLFTFTFIIYNFFIPKISYAIVADKQQFIINNDKYDDGLYINRINKHKLNSKLTDKETYEQIDKLNYDQIDIYDSKEKK